MFKRRIGIDPHVSGRATAGLKNCPDIWELEDGSIAFIGIRKTALLSAYLPDSASCGPDEEIVVLPRELIVAAKSFMPDS